ncbi:MAG: hypothetical protein AAGA15_04235 [Pseudomonadota bacterium]
MNRINTLVAATAVLAFATPSFAQVSAEECIAAGGTVDPETQQCAITQAQAEAAGLVTPADDDAIAALGTGVGGNTAILAGGAAVILLAILVSGTGSDSDSSSTTTTTGS